MYGARWSEGEPREGIQPSSETAAHVVLPFCKSHDIEVRLKSPDSRFRALALTSYHLGLEPKWRLNGNHSPVSSAMLYPKAMELIQVSYLRCLQVGGNYLHRSDPPPRSPIPHLKVDIEESMTQDPEQGHMIADSNASLLTF